MTKTFQLKQLEVGSKCSIPSLPDSFKNLVILRTGDCSIRVTGQKKESIDSNFVGFADRFAPNMEVIFDGEIVEVIESETGENSLTTSTSNEKRGRKKNFEVEFPNEPFILKELAEKLKLEYYQVTNEFNRNRNLFKEVGSKPNGGRGKPLKIWQKM